MPGTTPEMGIEYPCSGDTIDAGVFADYANSTQAALAEVSALQSALLRPPAVFVRRSSVGQSIAAGAVTAATFEAEGYDTDSMFTTASPGQVTVRSAGTYMANYGYVQFSQPTTLTSIRVAILVNGIEFAYDKSDEVAAGFVVDGTIWISALLPSLLVGDVLTFTILFTGTGNMNVGGTATVTRLSIV